MKPVRLDVSVSTNGHVYKLFRRSERVACYKQYDPSGLLVAYELFVIPIRKEEKIKNVTYPLREVFPSSSTFGINAWSLPIWRTEEEVIKRFEDLDKEQSNG